LTRDHDVDMICPDIDHMEIPAFMSRDFGNDLRNGLARLLLQREWAANEVAPLPGFAHEVWCDRSKSAAVAQSLDAPSLVSVEACAVGSESNEVGSGQVTGRRLFGRHGAGSLCGDDCFGKEHSGRKWARRCSWKAFERWLWVRLK